MKGVQCRPVNNSRLVPDEHALAIVEAVDHDCSRVPKLDLKDRLLVLVPPSLIRGVSFTF